MARTSVKYLIPAGLLASAALAVASAFAQAPAASTSPAPAAAAAKLKSMPPAAASDTHKQTVAPIAMEKPLWKDLSAAQQRALEPLKGEWNKLEGLRKQKWLEIANRYNAMKPDEQARVQERMRDWVRLTPDQRRMVRENFARSQKVAPGQKSAQWEQYQQLPDEQKKQLADKAPKKQVVNPPSPTQSKIQAGQTVQPVKRQGPAAHLPGASATGIAPTGTVGAPASNPASASAGSPASATSAPAAPATATSNTPPASNVK